MTFRGDVGGAMLLLPTLTNWDHPAVVKSQSVMRF
jgi:hypothetical protein